MNIELRIDEVVLDGLDLPPGGRDVLQQSLTAELSHLLGESATSGTWDRGYAVPEAAAGVVNVGRRSDPLALGEHLAGVVHSSLAAGQPSTLNPQLSTAY